MKKRTKVFLRESVVLFGFLNGLFLSLGVNPGATVLAILGEILESLTGGNGIVRLALTILPLALLGISLYLIHKRAGWVGFVAVGLAFLAGLWLIGAAGLAVALLVGGLAIGYLAAR